MGANLATPAIAEEPRTRRHGVKVHIADEYSEGMSYGGSTTAFDEGTTTLSYINPGDYHRRRNRDSFSGESPNNQYYYDYDERRGDKPAKEHRQARLTRERAFSARPYSPSSNRPPARATAVRAMGIKDEASMDPASMLACLDDERDALLKKWEETESTGTFSTLTCTVTPACQRRGDRYDPEVAVDDNMHVQKKLEELMKHQQIQEEKLERQLEQLRLQKERLQQIQAEKLASLSVQADKNTTASYARDEVFTDEFLPANDNVPMRVVSNRVENEQGVDSHVKNQPLSSRNEIIKKEAVRSPLHSIEEQRQLDDRFAGERKVDKSVINQAAKASDIADGDIEKEAIASASQDKEEAQREAARQADEEAEKYASIMNLDERDVLSAGVTRVHDNCGNSRATMDPPAESSVYDLCDIPDQVSSIDDEIDMGFVAQYDKAFNVFLATYPDLFEKSSELIQNLKVAKLQKILQVTYQIECDLENHVEASEELKAKSDAEFQYKLKEASRRKAARAIQLQADLSSIKKELKQTEGRLTWEMVHLGVNRATKLKHLKRDLKQATVGSDRKGLIALLPDSPGYKEIKIAALVSSDDVITAEKRQQLQKLQVDNAFLHAEAKTLERTVAYQKIEVKKQAWVDAVLLQLDAKKLKKLKVRYQKKLGVSF